MGETCPCACHRGWPCTLCGCRPAPTRERLLAALRAALARSEQRERALREALTEALSAVEIARPTLRAASLRPDASDAAWDTMLQRWRAALPLAREARASAALDGDTHCVDAPAAPAPTKEET
jgi:hypothetical protein